MTDGKSRPKRKPPLSLNLGDDLEQYLRTRAAASFRSLTSEIRMRLEQTRQAEQSAQEAKA